MNDLFSVLLASRPEARPSAPAPGTCKRLSRKQPSRAQSRARSQLVHEQNFAGFGAAQPFAKTLPLPYSFVTKAIAKFLTNRVGGIPRTISVIFILLSIFAACADEMPYHPFRKIGDYYYDLRLLYQWMKTTNHFVSDQPLAEWFISTEDLRHDYFVEQIIKDGVIVRRENGARGYFEEEGSMMLLKNYPNLNNLIDNEHIEFIAIKIGVFKGKTVRGNVRTLPLYDYGIPYDPVALARSQTNSTMPRNK